MGRKTLYAFIVSFILLIAVIILNRINFSRVQHYTERVDHTRIVISSFERLSNHLKSAQIYSANFDSGRLKDFYSLLRNEGGGIRQELTELRNLVVDNPPQVLKVDSIRMEVEEMLPVLMRYNIVELINQNRIDLLRQLYDTHLRIQRGIELENRLLAERRKQLGSSSRQNNLLTTAFGVLALGIIIVTFLSNFFISRKHRWLEGFTRSILDTSQSGVIHFLAKRKNEVVEDFEIGFMNLAAAGLMKTTVQEAMGRRLSELPHSGEQEQMLQAFVGVVTSGNPAEFEIEYQAGEEKRYFLVSLTRLDDGVIAAFNNITQIKRYESELKENIADLQRSNKELEQYAYVASHDLQEPLRKIRSFGSYLQDTQGDRLDEKGREQLNKMMASAERMSQLIRDILSFSSMRKEDPFSRVDLNEILGAVREDLELMITQKGARVSFCTLPSVEAIPLQMNQLFHNLISNALKFAQSATQPVIQVTSRPLTEEEKPEGLPPGPCHEIRIADNGIGFQQQYAEQIFGLFKRLNNKAAFPGSGIGLALCKKVVDNHHGFITAESEEGRGATFVIVLPEQQPKIVLATPS